MLRFPHRRAPWLTARYWFFNNLLDKRFINPATTEYFVSESIGRVFFWTQRAPRST
jgi:hypothetical protein